MSDIVKISQLPITTTVSTGDYIPVVEGGITKRVQAGSGGGLDADSIDTIESDRIIYGDTLRKTTQLADGNVNLVTKSGFYYVTGAGQSNTPYPQSWFLIHTNNPTSDAYAVQICVQAGSASSLAYMRTNNNGVWGAWSKLWNASNDGSGSGLDADTIDTYETTTTREASKIAPLNSGGYLPANGIAFPASQAASADANTLDDYEEGAFNPTLTFGGGNIGMTGSFTGRYTKIGGRVFFSLRVSLTAKGSSTGNAVIGNLPFTPLNDTANISPLAMYFSQVTYTGMMVAIVNSSGATITLGRSLEAGTFANQTDANFTDTSLLYISGHYSV